MNTTDLEMPLCIPVCWSGRAQTLGLCWWRNFWKVCPPHSQRIVPVSVRITPVSLWNLFSLS